mmetsp:Transcript_31055/g.99155  ORF Transcript_31055/g.99155 Transcript_31055/m.99155 type:complete len:259 (-) Transcript_31055:178-954(-)
MAGEVRDLEGAAPHGAVVPHHALQKGPAVLSLPQLLEGVHAPLQLLPLLLERARGGRGGGRVECRQRLERRRGGCAVGRLPLVFALVDHPPLEAPGDEGEDARGPHVPLARRVQPLRVRHHLLAVDALDGPVLAELAHGRRVDVARAGTVDDVNYLGLAIRGHTEPRGGGVHPRVEDGDDGPAAIVGGVLLHKLGSRYLSLGHGKAPEVLARHAAGMGATLGDAAFGGGGRGLGRALLLLLGSLLLLLAARGTCYHDG